jgi:outer membrane cobalamin receptor
MTSAFVSQRRRALAPLALLAAMPAGTQDAVTPAPQQLEEVIVSARRFEERLQATPVTVVGYGHTERTFRTA